MNSIGIRREDKSIWERRVPLTPRWVAGFVKDGIEVRVQPSQRRVFTDDEFRSAGAIVDEDLSSCDIIFGVKEIPRELFLEGKTYFFFSHIIKGQSYNMEMLRTMIQKKVNLIEYEKIVDDDDRRLVLFGRFAGLAGMIDTLHTYGERMAREGFDTPFTRIRFSHEYESLAEAKEVVSEVGRAVAAGEWPDRLVPLVCGFAGYGNVSKGAQEIFDLLAPETVAPGDLASHQPAGKLVKVVFHEEHMVRRKDAGRPFELKEYYNEPEKYEGIFEEHLPHLSVLMNTIYWEEQYPRLVTKDYLRAAWERGDVSLKVIGEISCDVEGSVECLVKVCDPGNPVYIYDPASGEVEDGFDGEGVALVAVEILPCELPRESSEAFSESLAPFIPELVKVDFDAPYEEWTLPAPLRKALILAGGEFSDPYGYIAAFLEEDRKSE